jgi:hypothetical protein
MERALRVRGALPAGVVAVVALSVACDLLFFTGFIASDDVLYLTAARKLAETGTLWPHPASHETRLLMIGWCALVGTLVRHDVQAIAASFVLFHQALNALTYLVGRQLLPYPAAVLAAVLTATCPLLVAFSTTILPDIPMTVCLLAALLTLWSAGRAPGAAPADLRLGMSGAFVGLAYLAKESGLVPVPFFLVLALRGPKDREPHRVIARGLRRGAAFLAGLGLVLGLEAMALRALTGSWLFRLSVLFDGQTAGSPFVAGLASRTARLADTIGVHLGASAAAAALVALLVAYGGRWRGLRSLVLFAFWYAAYYTWGSARLTSYYSPSLQPRYFIPTVPFLLVPLAALLWAGYTRAAAEAPRVHPGAPAFLRVTCLLVAAAALVWQLRRCDGTAGTVYGAPMASQSLRALRVWRSSGRGPLVVSASLAAGLFPLLRDHREGLLFSHEVGAEDLERWRHTGGFGFMDLHPASRLRLPAWNPLIGWDHGLPVSAGHAERLVQALLTNRTTESDWTLRLAGRFDRVGPRSAEARVLLGDPSAVSLLRPGSDRAVLVYELAPAKDDVRYPLSPLEPGRSPAVVNGALEQWTDARPAGWLARDTPVSPTEGADAGRGVRIGPAAFGYLWQSLALAPSLRGRDLLLRARVRTDTPRAARLWIKVAVGSEWEEVFGEPHRGDGTWQWLEAELPIPLQFSGGEARIVLLHDGPGHSEFDDVELSVR